MNRIISWLIGITLLMALYSYGIRTGKDWATDVNYGRDEYRDARSD
jgi:hypothetical protein